MIEKNPQALALAFKRARGKKLKIRELAITPSMDEEAIEALIEKLATAKSVDDASTFAEHVKGQRWFVEMLIKFSSLSVEEQMEAEYQDAFSDNASETEMLDALRALAA